MTEPQLLHQIGDRQSLLGSRFVGLMRTLGAMGLAATAGGMGLLGLGHIESKFPVVRRFDVPVFPRPGFHGLRILHLSDLHMFAGQDFLHRFLTRVARKEQFDLVVSTGDNLGDLSGVPLLLDALEPLAAKPGVFVLGSNDYYLPNPKPWTAYLLPTHHRKAAEKAKHLTPNLPWVETVNALIDRGWVDLSNQSTALTVDTAHGPVEVAVAGVDDPHIHRDRVPTPGPVWDSGDAIRLALTHAPYRRILDTFTQQGADLIAAGHTHGGQIRVPGFGALVNNTDIPAAFSRGLYRWEYRGKSSWLNISAGLGTSRFAQVRLFCRPEVSLLNLVPAV